MILAQCGSAAASSQPTSPLDQSANEKGTIVENRGLNFLVTALLIFAGLMIAQQFLFPKPNVPEGKKVAEKKEDQKEQTGDKKNANKKDDSGDKSKQDSKTDNKSDDKTSKSGSEKKSDQKKTDSKQKAKPAPVIKPGTFAKDQLLTIGSMDQTSGSRMLVTINRLGGTIRRIELNSRWPNGKLRYRDVENKSGYLGQLELSVVPSGLKVNLVGKGTPAELGDGESRIAVGDVFQSIEFDGETYPLKTKDEYDEVMAKTKPGEAITINYLRGSQTSSISIPLGDQPLNVIRPEPYLKYLDEKSGTLTPHSPESMQLTIMAPTGRVWPELDKSLRTGLWNVDPGTNENEVILSKQIDLDALDQTQFKAPYSGKLTVIKKYKLNPGDPEFKSRSLDRAYHVNFGFDLKYEGQGTHRFAFQIYGPTGTPVDGWWYQNKISGRTYSLFGTAGSRDIIGSSKGSGYVFHGGPKIVKNASKDKPGPIKIFDPSIKDAGQMKYLAVDTQYFTVALLPDESYETEDGNRTMDVYSAYVWVAQDRLAKVKRERRTTDISYRLFSQDIVLSDGQTESFNFELFAGPKEPGLLKQYNLKDVRSFGWFAFISKPLCGLLRLFYGMFSMIGLGSYGLAIILLTVLVRSAMIPISRKAALNAQMMQKLAPQMKEIAEKYKEDMEGRLKAQRELFSKNKYNPYGGCLLMFLQLPIFIGLYRGLSVDIALRDQPLIPGLKWCSNLAGPDQLWYWKDSLPSFLSLLTHETGWLGPYLNILPIVTIFLFLAQQKLFTPPATDDQQKMMQKMMTFMMIFMGFLFFKVSAGLCIYFITSSLWGIAERKLLPKPVLKDIGGAVIDGSDTPKKQEPAKVVLKQSEEEKKRRERQKREREKRKRGKGK